MLIESLIKREGGSLIEFDGGINYHFRPSAEHGGAHVCEVSNKKHLTMLLVTGVFAVFGDDEDEDEGGDDKTDSGADAQAQAPDDDLSGEGLSGMGADDDNQDKEPESAPAPASQAPIAEPAPADTPTYDDMTDDELADKHLEVFNKAAHPNAKRDTIIAKLKDAAADQA